MKYAKYVKMLLLGAGIGLVLAVVSYNWHSTKFPSCDLVARGIGVSTFGCSNTAAKGQACINEVPDSPEMVACFNKHYYRYKALPFGFTQKFGNQSNLVDAKVKASNAWAMFFLGLGLTLAGFYVKAKRTRTASVL